MASTCGSGAFVINHPINDFKNTHNLVHSFVEAPKLDLIYRDNIKITSNNVAYVDIDKYFNLFPGTFDLLNKNYPLRGDKCKKEDFMRPFEGDISKRSEIYRITKQSFIEQGLVFFGGKGVYMSMFSMVLIQKAVVLFQDYYRVAWYCCNTIFVLI